MIGLGHIVLSLRLLVGLWILLFVMWVGFTNRPLYYIGILGLCFTCFYIQGKKEIWKNLYKHFGKVQFINNLALTLLIQTILVSVFYFIGRGIGSALRVNFLPFLLQDLEILMFVGFLMITLLLGELILYLEKKSFSSTYINKNSKQDDELKLDPEPIEIESFWRSRHYSWQDCIYQVIHSSESEKKPKKFPVDAQEQDFLEIETRFKIKIPETLKKLYRIQNGGHLPNYYVPQVSQPKNNHDDWRGAFAPGYDDLLPLNSWQTVAECYEDYDDDSADEWFPSCDKIIILAKIYDECTVLDYRTSSDRPKVLLMNLDEDKEDRVKLEFSDFDSFFKALRKEKEDPIKLSREEKLEALRYSKGLVFSDFLSHQIWAWQPNMRADFLSVDSWLKIEKKLGRVIPQSLKEIYKHLNGGALGFYQHQSISEEKNKVIVPHKTLFEGEQFLSLTELSGRIEFVYETPWSQLFAKSEELIVISGSDVNALMLDYRESSLPEPRVLWVENLDLGEDKKNIKSFLNFSHFLSELKAYGVDYQWDRIEDPKISPRAPVAEAFFVKDDQKIGAKKEDIDELKENTGLLLPSVLEQAYLIQNGGLLQYNYLPEMKLNPYGYLNFDRGAKIWKEFMPHPICSVEEIKTLSDLEEELIKKFPDVPQTKHWSYVLYTDLKKILVLYQSDEKASELLVLDYNMNSYREKVQVKLMKAPFGEGAPQELIKFSGLSILRKHL